MPEPQSRRGNVITEATFENPFTTPIFPLGVGGLDLTSAVDKIEVGHFARLTNVRYLPGEPRRMTTRLGQLEIVSGATGEYHSAVRMDDPEIDDQMRFWGVGTDLYRGFAGGLAIIDSGYSGDPLTLLPHRPPLSGDPWTFIADSERMRKTRFDGLTLEIGMRAPTNPTTLVLGTENRTAIDDFTNDAWTPNAGRFLADDPTIATELTPVPAPPASGVFTLPNWDAGIFTLASKLLPFYVFWGRPTSLNLNLVGGVTAVDNDIMHILMSFSHPWRVKEIRIYYVVSETFSPSILPGTTAANINRDFYLKVFRSGDFSAISSGNASQTDAAEVSRVIQIRERALNLLATEKGFARAHAETVIRKTSAFLQQLDPSRSTSLESSASAFDTIEYGAVGNPLRRGDWERYGSTAGRDWGTVTGIIVYVQSFPIWPPQLRAAAESTQISLTQAYYTGGSGPDSSEPGAQSYDVRHTNYDPRTGAEGNPSPTMAIATFLDPLRRSMVATPAAYGDADVRQRFYVRGGTITDNWYFAGTNDGDGNPFTVTDTDITLLASSPVEIDHYQPVPTVDDAGNTVLAQPVPVLFGPYNGQLFALGDPHRPGHVYACIPDEPDHWPADLVHEVCSPSEQLMNGFLYGGQPYVFSRERLHVLYPNVTGNAGMSSAPTECRRGLVGRWAYTIGKGVIWFVGKDGVYRTTGGSPEDVSGAIKPLFQNQSRNGYFPIDTSDDHERDLRLAIFQDELYFRYVDSQNVAQVMVLQVETGQWRHYGFANEVSCIYAEDSGGDNFILGGRSSNVGYLHENTDDDGQAIPAHFRTGSWDWGRPREEKLLGDQILDADTQGVDINWTNYLNSETIVNPTQLLAAAAGRTRTIFDGFGPNPQKARNLAVDVTWETAGTPPELYFLGTSITTQPDLTVNRVTNWDDLGHPDEAYVMGITLDCDTGNQTRHITIQRDFNGQIVDIITLDVTHNGRHKKKYSWPAVPANQVRIKPDDQCIAWLLYRADWIWFPEPPRIAKWDIHFEGDWDQYHTGLDLQCDTFGATKRIEVYVDGVLLLDPATGNPFYDIVANGRQVVHLTLPWGRGHVYHFIATDDNPGLLYKHRWHLEAEPSEQHNWNQPFTILGTQADKWLKAVVMECDTFNAVKTIEVQSDEHDMRATFTVQADGRKVVQVSFPQVLGRVFRFFPVDHLPSRLYSIRPIFDEEPFQLSRWETQETDFDTPGFKSLIDADVTIKSTADVTLEITCYTNQDGTGIVTDTYTIPQTTGIKDKRYVPFIARKGVLYKFVFTSPEPFWLYGKESSVIIQPWMGGEPLLRRPFGDDDADETRPMVNTTLAAARSGGGT